MSFTKFILTNEQHLSIPFLKNQHMTQIEFSSSVQTARDISCTSLLVYLYQYTPYFGETPTIYPIFVYVVWNQILHCNLEQIWPSQFVQLAIFDI